MHCHPMAHLGFGGRVIAGAPWHERGIDQALANCEGVGGAHRAFGFAGSILGYFIREQSEAHGPCGAPTFLNWPRHDTLYHQQMYIDWLRRAHVHGLRLMCAVAVNNELLARLCGAVRYSDPNMLESQVRGLRQMVAHAERVALDAGQPPWLGIADSPAAARSLIADGRLALVVGVEMDTLESLARRTGNDEPSHLSAGPSLPTRSLHDAPFELAEVGAVLDALQALGVSMVNPVHLADNSFGGTAIYDDRFDLLNRWLRGSYLAAEPSPEVAFQLGKSSGVTMAAMRALAQVPPRSDAGLNGPEGHVNAKGLSPVGRAFVEEAMRRGFIVDVDHLSSKAVDEVLALARARNYPVVSSHATFRELGLLRDETADTLAQRNEAMRSLEQVDAILALGGMVAPLTHQHRCRSHGSSAVANDCHGSSKSFAQAFLYAVEAVQRAGNGGVALGSDFNGSAQQPRPRYGPGSTQLDVERVLYEGEGDPAAIAAYFTGRPLSRHRLPGRAQPFDINVDGLAHYGMLADFVEELRRVHIPPQAIDTLFDSAEAFVQLWERCRAGTPP